jgi:hypothetical protein
MPTDKKISQLPVASGISTSDISVLVDLDTTEQYSFSQLLTYLAANLQSGAVFTFGTAAIPSNSVGNDGDVYVKTDTGQFAQKLSGTWTVVYTIVQGVVGSQVLYGTVAPTTQGINGDTYLLTTNGTFYNKIAGSWVAKFSMATGPVGPAGAAGTNGTDGTNGLTILNGLTNPSNGLGVNGDFYINTFNWTMFGPKAAGAWPAGFSLIGPPGAPLDPAPTVITAGVTATPLTISYNALDYPAGAKYELIRAPDNKYDWNTNVAKFVPVSGSASFVIYGDDDGTGHFADSFTFSILA